MYRVILKVQIGSLGFVQNWKKSKLSIWVIQNSKWTTQKTRLKRFNETTICEIADDEMIFHNVVKRRLHNFDIARFDYGNGSIKDYFRPGEKLQVISEISEFSNWILVVTYKINNRDYGPSGLESHGAAYTANCICIRNILSKFDCS